MILIEQYFLKKIKLIFKMGKRLDISPKDKIKWPKSV